MVFHLKHMTLNVQSAMHIHKGYWQYPLSFWKWYLPHSQKMLDSIVKFIKDNGVGILVLNEIDDGSRRTKFVSQVSYIAKESGLSYKTFCSGIKKGKWINQGNAIISRFPILSHESIKLPGKGEPRNLAHAIIDVSGRKIHIFGTHLSLKKEYREAQIEKIRSVLKDIKGYKILSGDMNTSEISGFENLKHDIFLTYPSWKPKKAYDYIFSSKEMNISKKKVTENIGSDHRGLLYTFDLE